MTLERNTALRSTRGWDDPKGLGWQLWQRSQSPGLLNGGSGSAPEPVDNAVRDPVPLATDVWRRWNPGQESGWNRQRLDMPFFAARLLPPVSRMALAQSSPKLDRAQWSMDTGALQWHGAEQPPLASRAEQSANPVSQTAHADLDFGTVPGRAGSAGLPAARVLQQKKDVSGAPPATLAQKRATTETSTPPAAEESAKQVVTQHSSDGQTEIDRESGGKAYARGNTTPGRAAADSAHGAGAQVRLSPLLFGRGGMPASPQREATEKAGADLSSTGQIITAVRRKAVAKETGTITAPSLTGSDAERSQSKVEHVPSLSPLLTWQYQGLSRISAFEGAARGPDAVGPPALPGPASLTRRRTASLALSASALWPQHSGPAMATAPQLSDSLMGPGQRTRTTLTSIQEAPSVTGRRVQSRAGTGQGLDRHASEITDPARATSARLTPSVKALPIAGRFDGRAASSSREVAASRKAFTAADWPAANRPVLGTTFPGVVARSIRTADDSGTSPNETARPGYRLSSMAHVRPAEPRPGGGHMEAALVQQPERHAAVGQQLSTQARVSRKRDNVSLTTAMGAVVEDSASLTFNPRVLAFQQNLVSSGGQPQTRTQARVSLKSDDAALGRTVRAVGDGPGTLMPSSPLMASRQTATSRGVQPQAATKARVSRRWDDATLTPVMRATRQSLELLMLNSHVLVSRQTAAGKGMRPQEAPEARVVRHTDGVARARAMRTFTENHSMVSPGSRALEPHEPVPGKGAQLSATVRTLIGRQTAGEARTPLSPMTSGKLGPAAENTFQPVLQQPGAGGAGQSEPRAPARLMHEMGGVMSTPMKGTAPGPVGPVSPASAQASIRRRAARTAPHAQPPLQDLLSRQTDDRILIPVTPRPTVGAELEPREPFRVTDHKGAASKDTRPQFAARSQLASPGQRMSAFRPAATPAGPIQFQLATATGLSHPAGQSSSTSSGIAKLYGSVYSIETGTLHRKKLGAVAQRQPMSLLRPTSAGVRPGLIRPLVGAIHRQASGVAEYSAAVGRDHPMIGLPFPSQESGMELSIGHSEVSSSALRDVAHDLPLASRSGQSEQTSPTNIQRAGQRLVQMSPGPAGATAAAGMPGEAPSAVDGPATTETEATAGQAPVDLDELVEKAWQKLMRKLAIEQERRGCSARWN